jgi:16S rRNA processing protein RimM
MNPKQTQQKKGRQKSGGKEKVNSPSPMPHSPFPMPNLDDWIEIGKIVAPQGLAGELRVYPETDFPERFEESGTRWLLRPGEKEPQPIELLAGRYVEGKNLYIIELAGVENRNQAEELRDCRLFVPISDRPQLSEDEYHVLDLIGIEVFLQDSGELLGTVVDVIPAGNDLLEVQLTTSPDSEKKPQKVLIPFVKAIAPIVDIPSRRIEITPPAGLLELATGG